MLFSIPHGLHRYTGGIWLLAALSIAAPATGQTLVTPTHPFAMWGTVAPRLADPISIPTQYVEADPSFGLGPEYSARPDDGVKKFRPFACSYLGPMHPRLRPSPAELADPSLEMLVTPGEYEAAALGVFAVRPIQHLHASIGELRGPRGQALPAACLDLRWVRFMPNYAGKFAYRLDPLILEKRPAIDLAEQHSAFLWLTVYAPPKALAGVYKGTVTLSAPGAPAQSTPITVKVLSFTLVPNEKTDAMLYTFDWRGDMARGNPAKMSEEFSDMHMHGMNSLAYLQQRPPGKKAPDGHWVFDFTRPSPNLPFSMTRTMETMQQTGLGKALFLNYHGVDKYSELYCGAKWGTPESSRYFTDLFMAWGREAKTHHWPQIVHNIGDEPTGAEQLQTAIALARLVKAGAPSNRTSCFCDGQYHGEDDAAEFGNVLDDYISAPLNMKGADEVRKDHMRWLLYNQAPPDDPIRCRYAYGFELEALGAAGLQQFMYRIMIGDKAKDPLANCYQYVPASGVINGGENVWIYSWPTDDGLLPNPAFEAIREGVDDGRYVATLRFWLAKARGSRSPAARETSARIDAALQSLIAGFAPYDAQGKYRVGTSWLMRDDGQSLQTARFQVVDWTLEVQKALRA